jgi:hypothetical protein
MKTLIFTLCILFGTSVCFGQTQPAKASSTPAKNTSSTTKTTKTTKSAKAKTTATSSSGTWEKTKDNTWMGYSDGQPYRYKLDGTKLLWSSDGKTWDADPDGMWADKEGTFYKIEDQKLVWSPDAGNTWQDIPEWRWQAIDDRWYKVDKDWTVWVSKSTK